ncbi:MAG: hypothetical protein QM831_15470 [Kofleriaceae bacterium]
MTCIDLAQLDEVTGGFGIVNGKILEPKYPYGPDPLYPRRHPGQPVEPSPHLKNPQLDTIRPL